MTAWKFLHVATMFAAVSIFVGQGLLSEGILRTGDVPAMRRVLATEATFGPVGGALFGLGLVFGVFTALAGDVDLTEPWLLISYALVVYVFVNGVLYHRPRAKVLRTLANDSPDHEPSEHLLAVIHAPSARYVMVIDSFAWLGIIFVMVVKPFA